MAAMRDQSGKKLGSDNTLVYTGESGNLTNIGTAYVTLIKAEALDRNLVALTFNTRINNLNPADILFRQASDGNVFSQPIQVQTIQSIETNAQGQSVYVVFIDRQLNTDATWDDNTSRERVEIQTTSSSSSGTTGTQLAALGHGSAILLQDGFGGGIARDASNVYKIAWRDFDNNGKLDTVTVEYDEAILAASLSTLTYTVQGYTVAGISTDTDGIVAAGSQGDRAAGSRFVVLNITQPGQGMDAGTQPVVAQLYPIQDAAGNYIE